MKQVRAEVKSILVFHDDNRHDVTLDGFIPADPAHFGFRAQVFIGETTDELCDSFDMVVCSPSWLAEQVAEGNWGWSRNVGLGLTPDSVIVGAGVWFMRRWVRDEFENALRVITEAASPGPDWGSVAARIGRFIPWEYNYKYDDHVDKHYGEAFPPVQ